MKTLWIFAFALTALTAQGNEGSYLTQYLDQVNKRNELLIESVKKGDTRSVGYLIQHGADINSKTWIGQPLVYLAVQVNDLDMVKYLISIGADPYDKYLFYRNIADYAQSLPDADPNMVWFLVNNY